MPSYHELLGTLYSVNATLGMKLGLEDVFHLHTLLGAPAHRFQVVHVAGTNGKGSVTAKIAKGLQGRYSCVGVFTSPHISTFRERIRINDTLITEKEIATVLPPILRLAEKEKIPATFFTLATLLAFCYFANKKVNIAVVETGLGGRLDATNIVNPLLSVITSIGFDHTELLGETLDAIAREKAGIIKPPSPVVLGPKATMVPVPAGSHPVFVPGSFNSMENENRAIARRALEFLGLDEKIIKKALTTRLPCRLERIPQEGKDVMLDVAHNPPALERLFQDMELPKRKVRVALALSKTKDLPSCLSIVNQCAQDIHIIEAPNGRSAPKEQLKECLLSQGVAKNRIHLHESISHCIQQALCFSQREDQSLVACGSFFIMSEVRKSLGIVEPSDPVDLNER